MNPYTRIDLDHCSASYCLKTNSIKQKTGIWCVKGEKKLQLQVKLQNETSTNRQRSTLLSSKDDHKEKWFANEKLYKSNKNPCH